MRNKCIISFANSTNNYIKGLARLSESLRHNFDGDFLGFINESTLGAPSHHKNPYAFKVYAFRKAIQQGYNQILWLDSSAFAIKNVQPVFDEITKDGFIFQDAGHFLGHWTNDKTLAYFGISRDEAMEIKMIGNAGFLGLDMTNTFAQTILEEWERAMLKGFFKGKWNNDHQTESLDERCRGHRHDMSCSSSIIHNLGIGHMKKHGEQWLQYAGLYDETINDTIIFKAQGL